MPIRAQCIDGPNAGEWHDVPDGTMPGNIVVVQTNKPAHQQEPVYLPWDHSRNKGPMIESTAYYIWNGSVLTAAVFI